MRRLGGPPPWRLDRGAQAIRAAPRGDEARARPRRLGIHPGRERHAGGPGRPSRGVAAVTEPTPLLLERLSRAAECGLEANVRAWLRFVGHRDGEPIELQALDVPDGRY